MYYRYPRLRRIIADERVKNLQACAEDPIPFALSDSYSTPVETGTVVPASQLKAIRIAMKGATKGFPSELRSTHVAAWDAAVGQALYEHMGIAPADASHVDTWSFITLVVLPDFAVIRYPNRPKNRLIGSNRNVFRRVWWRHYLIGELEVPNGAKPLGEDELVNIFERSRMARDHNLVRVLAEEILAYKGTGRSVFARKLTLRVRALTGSQLLDICPVDELRKIVGEIAKQVLDMSENSPKTVVTVSKKSGFSRLVSAIRKRG